MRDEAFDYLATVREVQDDFGSVRTFLQTRDGASVDLDLRVGTQGAGEGVEEGIGTIGVDGDGIGGELKGVAGKVHSRWGGAEVAHGQNAR